MGTSGGAIVATGPSEAMKTSGGARYQGGRKAIFVGKGAVARSAPHHVIVASLDVIVQAVGVRLAYFASGDTFLSTGP